MSRSENNVCLCANLHDTHYFGLYTSTLVQYGYAFPSAVVTQVMIDGILRGHPNTTAKLAGSVHRFLSSKNIHPVAMHPVHAEAAEHLEVRQCLTDKIGTVVIAEIVAFEQDRTVARIMGGTGKSQFVAQTGFGIGGGMEMNVTDTFQEVIGYRHFPVFRFFVDCYRLNSPSRSG